MTLHVDQLTLASGDGQGQRVEIAAGEYRVRFADAVSQRTYTGQAGPFSLRATGGGSAPSTPETPESPVTPESPSTPDTPASPDTPTSPDTPDASPTPPVSPVEPEDEGGGGCSSGFGALALAALGAAALKRRS